ncbi:hypothetical protein EYF80_010311 [Liparis tanakae]|uniref:Uncharacterized protein n=1 Tax=Liparis tanakae TaxID=230148 RepID=A0A4Z2INN0_9TELE|nr:hypothetical protein EYF80_010311 [Liparis tanakae]
MDSASYWLGCGVLVESLTDTLCRQQRVTVLHCTLRLGLIKHLKKRLHTISRSDAGRTRSVLERAGRCPRNLGTLERTAALKFRLTEPRSVTVDPSGLKAAVRKPTGGVRMTAPASF